MREARAEPSDALLAFTLDDYLAPALNELLRTHWATRKKRLWDAMSRIRRALGAPPYQRIEGPLTARVVRCRPGGRELDYDNAVGSFKLIGDALERIRVIRNDRQIEVVEVEQVTGGRWTSVALYPIFDGSECP